MNYLQLMYVLGLCSCFFCTKGGQVRFNATRTRYKVGDTVTLMCTVRSDWLTISFGRNNSDLGWCSSRMKNCVSPADIREKHGNYLLKLEKSGPMLVIKNVSIDDAGANFTCHWTTYTATLSFAVTDEPVQLKTTYTIGNTVTLACYVRSSWQTVSFSRNNAIIGFCSKLINRCDLSAEMLDNHWKYELKLKKSHLMLVIKNVDIDDNGADFTCQWTSYAVTLSFAVTDLPVHEEKLSDRCVVPYVVIVSLVVIVQAILIILIVKQPVFYRRRVARFKTWLGISMNKRKHASGKGKELQQLRKQLCDDKNETKYLLTQGVSERQESQQSVSLNASVHRRKARKHVTV